MKLSPGQQASLDKARRQLFGSIPATGAGRTPDPQSPADTRPRFDRGLLKGRLINVHDRFEEEVAPDLVLSAANGGDPDANRIVEARKGEFDRWLEETTRREKAEQPARSEAESRRAIQSLGVTIPEGMDSGAFYEAHAAELTSLEKAAALRASASELSTTAERVAAEAQAAMATKAK